MDGKRFLNCATVNFYKRELALPNFLCAVLFLASAKYN